jgi:citrate lyase beta subunit
MLFVSGETPERFDKALAAGADLVCLDLEDAVRPALKRTAREQVFAWAAAHHGAPIGVRLNLLRSPQGLDDIAALSASGLVFDHLILPKVELSDDLSLVHAWVGDRFEHLVALVETPLGIENAAAIAAALGRGAPKLRALMLGGADLSVELGCAFGWDGLLHARARLVNAARASGLQAWDVPHLDLADVDGLREETRRAVALGFDCKTAIHPRQIPTIHEAFVPAAAELAWARDLLASPGANEGGAFLFQGRMVDAPVLAKARCLARRAR